MVRARDCQADAPELAPEPFVGVPPTCEALEWAPVAASSFPPGRHGHALAYDAARGRVVLFGGYGVAGLLGDTWEWDGERWTEAARADGPPARYRHALAYDEARRRTVLFGGYADAGNLADTWEWDGGRWERREPLAAPGARHGHALAHDVARGVTVLVGGMGSAAGSSHWEWDGTHWTARWLAGAPQLDGHHALAHDAARGRTVLCRAGGGLVVDTWEWDGELWQRRPAAEGPALRAGIALAHDPARGVTVAFGERRTTAGEVLPATWAWDGSRWTRQALAASPPPRDGHALAHHAGRGVTVLFGGSGGSRYLHDTWVLRPSGGRPATAVSGNRGLGGACSSGVHAVPGARPHQGCGNEVGLRCMRTRCDGCPWQRPRGRAPA